MDNFDINSPPKPPEARVPQAPPTSGNHAGMEIIVAIIVLLVIAVPVVVYFVVQNRTNSSTSAPTVDNFGGNPSGSSYITTPAPPTYNDSASFGAPTPEPPPSTVPQGFGGQTEPSPAPAPSQSYSTYSPTPQPSENSVSAVRLSQSGDKAGAWYKFSSDGSADWVWKMTLKLAKPETVKSVTIRSNSSGEYWSTTANDQYINGQKLDYPLVIFTQAGVQLNSAYDQPFGYDSPTPSYGNFEFPAGTYTYTLYGQKSSSIFPGGVVTVSFRDLSSISGAISQTPVSP